MRAKLTDKRVQNAKPPKAGRVELADTLEPGLALRITEDDRRTWTLRLWVGPPPARKQRRIKLGHPRERDGSPKLTLAQAREEARNVKQAAYEGKPLTPGDGTAKGAATWGDLADAYVAWMGDNKRPRTVAETARVLRHADLAPWRQRPAASITAEDVRALRDRITERGAAVQATRTLRIVGALGRWAVSEGKLDAAPAKGIMPRTAETPRDRVLDDREVAALWRAAGAIDYPFGDLFRMLLLTAQRLREVSEMTWDEVSFPEARWTIPRARTKNGQPHVVHLSPPVAAILSALAEQRHSIPMRRSSPYVFTTIGTAPVSGYSRSKDRLDAEMAKEIGSFPNFALHDLRRTAASVMARLKVAPHVIEKVLNHSGGRAISGVAAVYNQHDYAEERADALAKLGRCVTLLAEPNVVQLHTA
jgi:integrase